MSGFISYPYAVSVVAVGGGAVGGELLAGETDAMGIDFTYHTDITKQIYISDLTTPANNYNGTAQGKLTYTSPSLKMTRQSDGVYRYTNHNLCLQSQTFGTTWTQNGATVTANSTTAPDGTSTADTLTCDIGNAERRIFQDVSNYLGFVGSISVYAKAGTVNYIGLTHSGSSADAATFELTGSGTVGNVGGSLISTSITSVGSGWYRCSITGVLGSDSYHIINVGDTAAHAVAGVAWSPVGNETVYVWGAQYKRTPVEDDGTLDYYLATTTSTVYDLPYEWDAALASQGILIEEQRTNLLGNSQAIVASVGASVSANATTAPDGTATADQLIEDSGNTRHMAAAGSLTSITAGNPATVSIFAKQNTRRYFTLNINAGGGKFGATFDLQTGTATGSTGTTGTPTGTSAAISDAGNGWYRCSVTAISGTGADAEMGISDSATPTYFSAMPTYTGNGTGSIYLWGIQSEAGSFATSPIHTIAATVTRAVDTITLATSGFPYSTTESTLVLGHMQDNTANTDMVAINEAGGGDHLGISRQSGDMSLIVYTGFAPQSITGTSPPTINVVNKTAIACKVNDFAVVLNNGSVGTDGAGSMPSGLTTLSFNPGTFVGAVSRHYVTQFTYLKRRATNTELQTRTT